MCRENTNVFLFLFFFSIEEKLYKMVKKNTFYLKKTFYKKNRKKMRPEPKFLKINGMILQCVKFELGDTLKINPPIFYFDIETEDLIPWKPFAKPLEQKYKVVLRSDTIEEDEAVLNQQRGPPVHCQVLDTQQNLIEDCGSCVTFKTCGSSGSSEMQFITIDPKMFRVGRLAFNYRSDGHLIPFQFVYQEPRFRDYQVVSQGCWLWNGIKNLF